VNLWPWLAVAAAGALHGLNPVAGWAFGLRALAPVAAGHAIAVAVVAAGVPIALQLGLEFDPLVMQSLAGVGLVAMAVGHRHRRAAVGLWAFIVGMAHGAGWMLIPALVPLCAGDGAVREITASGSMLLALAAVGVHMAAMLGTMAAMAAGAGWALRYGVRRLTPPPSTHS
jgi:hypothetical protein